MCKSSFHSVQRLDNHLRTIHPNAGPMNICEFCQKSFLVERQLSYHIDEFHEHESKYLDKPFACPADLCEKRFRLESSLSQHAELHTPPTRNYAKRKKKLSAKEIGDDGTMTEKAQESPCSTCGKMLSASCITQHIATCSRSALKCKDCDKSFSNKYHLKSHQISKYLLIKVACPVAGCGKLFSSRAVAKIHVKNVHESNVRHQCDHCEKSFKLHHDLKQHINAVHEGKKVQCSFCDRDFVRTSEKNRHERQIHGREKSSKDRN